jgi:hypothetical protein
MMGMLPFPLTPRSRRRVLVRVAVLSALVALAAAARWTSWASQPTPYLSRTQNVTSSQK